MQEQRSIAQSPTTPASEINTHLVNDLNKLRHFIIKDDVEAFMNALLLPIGYDVFIDCLKLILHSRAKEIFCYLCRYPDYHAVSIRDGDRDSIIGLGRNIPGSYGIKLINLVCVEFAEFFRDDEKLQNLRLSLMDRALTQNKLLCASIDGNVDFFNTCSVIPESLHNIYPYMMIAAANDQVNLVRFLHENKQNPHDNIFQRNAMAAAIMYDANQVFEYLIQTQFDPNTELAIDHNWPCELPKENTLLKLTILYVRPNQFMQLIEKGASITAEIITSDRLFDGMLTILAKMMVESPHNAISRLPSILKKQLDYEIRIFPESKSLFFGVIRHMCWVLREYHSNNLLHEIQKTLIELHMAVTAPYIDLLLTRISHLLSIQKMSQIDKSNSVREMLTHFNELVMSCRPVDFTDLIKRASPGLVAKMNLCLLFTVVPQDKIRILLGIFLNYLTGNMPRKLLTISHVLSHFGAAINQSQEISTIFQQGVADLAKNRLIAIVQIRLELVKLLTNDFAQLENEIATLDIENDEQFYVAYQKFSQKISQVIQENLTINGLSLSNHVLDDTERDCVSRLQHTQEVPRCLETNKRLATIALRSDSPLKRPADEARQNLTTTNHEAREHGQINDDHSQRNGNFDHAGFSVLSRP